ncbi:hypothetical protein [Streptomyces antibioticus]|uniref:hypothetical protein n=1 Tax=Streptomyces antibioticus TaxID=1890 RepID=UPI00368DE225
MLRHEFQPGRLVAGGFLVLAGIAYAGDAGGLWEVPWFAVIPMVVGGLCLGGAAGVVAHAVRAGHGGHGRQGGHGGHGGRGGQGDPGGHGPGPGRHIPTGAGDPDSPY